MPGEGETLAQFLDVLLPGDDLFPAASRSGMVALAAERLRAACGLEEGIVAALLRHGWEAVPPDDDARGAVVAAVEAAEPQLFAELRKIAYLTYYEQPLVIAAIQALGFAYNTTPLPDGYPAAAFDDAVDTPRHGRGGWVATDAVSRVDLSGLDDGTGGRT